MVADILSPIPKITGDQDIGKIFSDEHTLRKSKINLEQIEKESSNGMLDDLGSPDLEDFQFLKNYDEDKSPFAKLVQSDALEFTI